MVRSRGQRIFGVVNSFILVMLAAAALLPFIHVIAKSTSAEGAVMAGDVTLFPIGFNLRTYRVVLGTYAFWRSLEVSFFVTVVGTLLHVLILSLAAYPLSRRVLPGKRVLTFLFVFTMLFNGGLIPTYLVVRSLGLINRLWALILPGPHRVKEGGGD